MITDTETTKLVGTATMQRKYWSSKAGDWATLMEPTAMPVYQAILGKIHLSPGIRLLDVGCGAGLFCRTAA